MVFDERSAGLTARNLGIPTDSIAVSVLILVGFNYEAGENPTSSICNIMQNIV
jgi:hypothetical protein